MIYGRPVGGSRKGAVIPMYTGSSAITYITPAKGYIELFSSGELSFVENAMPDRIDVWICGGGGGSTGYNQDSSGYPYMYHLPAGGAGAYCAKALNMVPATSTTVTIGAGGRPASAGGASSFGDGLTANGGGGATVAGGIPNGGNGGSGGGAGSYTSVSNMVCGNGGVNGGNGTAATGGQGGAPGTGDGLSKMDFLGNVQCGGGAGYLGTPGGGTYGVGGTGPSSIGGAAGTGGYCIVRWGDWSAEDAALEGSV